jgi:hypothetical protein
MRAIAGVILQKWALKDPGSIFIIENMFVMMNAQ